MSNTATKAVEKVPEQQLSREQAFVAGVRQDLSDIKHSFFRIGAKLREAQMYGLYRKLGYNSLEECAEALFDLKKSTTYELINVYDKFRDRKSTEPKIADRYKKFSQSQLVALSGCKYGLEQFMRHVDEKDTVATLKSAVKHYQKAWIHCKSKECPQEDETLEQYVERMKPAPEPKQEVIVIEEKSEYSENPQVEAPAPAPDNTFLGKLIRQLAYKLEQSEDVKVVFADNGEKVSYDGFCESILVNLLQCIVELGKDFQAELHEVINRWISSYAYEIKLHGRGQAVSVFAGNITKEIFRKVLDIRQKLGG